MKKPIWTVLLATLLLNLSACGILARPTDDESESAVARAEDERPAQRDAKGPTAPTKARATNLFEDPMLLRQALAKRLGPDVRVKEIIFYPTRAEAVVQVPDDPLALDEYTLAGGHLDGPSPVRIFGHKPTPESMRANTFALSEVPLDKLPAMIDDAPKRVKGEVTHAIVKRGVPFHTEVRWRIFVNSPRRSGFVDYALDGQVVEVSD